MLRISDEYAESATLLALAFVILLYLGHTLSSCTSSPRAGQGVRTAAEIGEAACDIARTNAPNDPYVRLTCDIVDDVGTVTQKTLLVRRKVTDAGPD
jgi:hypothetical protein